MTVLAPEATDREELHRVVAELSAIERPSASEGERRAAELVAARFRDAGLEPRIEGEQAHGGFWWPIGLLNAVALLAARIKSRLLALAALALLVDDVDHRARLFRKLLPKRPTWNVTAETGDPDAERTVVLVAHHDAAHGGKGSDNGLVYSLFDRFPQLLSRATRWPPMM